jgi:peroxiredoxin
MNGFVLGLAVVVLLVLGGAAFLLYQILQQQGRMLLRIDHLEHMAGMGGAHQNVPVGPPVGSAVDPFVFPDVEGREVALADLAGNKALLVNWSPTCGYCDLIGPDLAALGPELEKANTRLVLVAQGDAATNRALAEKHGITSPILLVGGEQPAGFGGVGTPAAILVDERGKVAGPLVVGADKVPELARELAAAGAGGKGKKLRGQRSVSESRLQRDGLKAGTPAPAFTLPDVHGRPVSLDDFRGRRVLLAFSDPDCAPCDALAPHLARLHEEHRGNNLDVILVGRGELEENRRKAEQYGFAFPVVVQQSWNLSKLYGIFHTPVAFLIDENGTIARDVAKGVDEIVAMIPTELGGQGGHGG